MGMSRRESTEALTALAFSWLWARRGCRVMADEVGVTGLCRFLCPSTEGLWRADAVGCTKKDRSYRLDLIEVKGSRADARREDMSRGKWEMLPESRRLTGWLLMSHDVKDEDIIGLPVSWGLLRASEDGTVVSTVRKAQEHWLPEAEMARDLHVLAVRTLGSRLPWMGRTQAESLAALHVAAETPRWTPEEFVGIDSPLPDPLPDHIPGGIPLTRVLDVDHARTFPVHGRLESMVAGKGSALIAIRGVDGGSIIGYASVRPTVGGGYSFEGAIDYETPERLLLETGEGRPAVTASASGISIVWAQSQS